MLWVQSLANEAAAGKSEPQIGAIVGYAPLERGQAADTFLDAMVHGAPLFRGIRRILELTPPTAAGGAPALADDPCWFMKTPFTRGLGLLAERNLHFELLTREESQFECALQLMHEAPTSLRVVVQHLGGPNMTSPTFFPRWKSYIEQMGALARQRPGEMVLKISGVPERAVGSFRSFDDWSVKQVQPFLSAAVAAFGPDRCIFGSNLFVLDTFSTAARWTAGLETMLMAANVTGTDLTAVLSGNAKRFYRIE